MRVSRVRWPVAACLAVLLGVIGLGGAPQAPRATPPPPPAPLGPAASYHAGALRLHGLVEPVSSYAVTAPRLAASQAGPGSQLVIVRLAGSGTVVRKGDLLVEFDRHGQLKAAHDRESEYRDLLDQVRRKRAEQRIAKARRDTELVQAANALEEAELDMLGIELVPKIQAEKNQQALDEARAHLDALRTTQALRDTADAAELRMLELQRDRARNAWHHAQVNAGRMLIASPIDGLVVLKSTWRGGNMAIVQEGEEVRPGIPILDVVDPSAMRVRALVNQADVERLAVGHAARVTLDSHPARVFDGRLEHLSPIATASALNPRVRNFVAVFSIDGSDPHLLPDLAAAIDVLPGRATPEAGGGPQ